MPVSDIRLASHVRTCRIDDQMIFLDLRRSKYIGIGGAQVAALSAALLGRGADERTAADATLQLGLRRLREQHLLADASTDEPASPVPDLATPGGGITLDDEDRADRAAWRDLPRLWRSTATTAAWLRWRNLADIADRVAALRARHGARADAPAADAMRLAAARYGRLRPFALTAHDRCLHDSLALSHFLACQGLFARWVVGVRVRPFGAHSWVQAGDVVLNDQPEHVRRYRPLLVV